MKLYINDKVANLSTKKEGKTDLEAKITKGLDKVIKEFKVMDSGVLKMRYHKKYYVKETFTDSNGHHPYYDKVLPTKSIPLFCTATYDGEVYDIRYATSQVKNQNGSFSYKGDRMSINSDTQLKLENRALLAFMSLFSTHVTQGIKITGLTKRNATQFFFFENIEADAKTALDKRKIAFNTYTLVSEMSQTNVKKLSHLININYRGEDIDTIKENVIAAIEKSEDNYNTLTAFNEDIYNKVYDIEANVLKYLKADKIAFQVKPSPSNKAMTVYWGIGASARKALYAKDDIIHSYAGSSADKQVLIDYLADNKNNYNDFLLRLEE
jgi:hypothetical protein